MDDKRAFELFKFYFDDLKSVSSGYFNFEITMSITIITIIGWFLTSDKAQKLTGANKYMVPIFIITISLTMLAELYTIIKIKCMSDNIAELLKTIAAYLSPKLTCEYFQYREIGSVTVIVFYIFHFFLLFTLAYVILDSKKQSLTERENSL